MKWPRICLPTGETIYYADYLLAFRLSVHGAMLGFENAWNFPHHERDLSPDNEDYYMIVGQICGVIMSGFLINQIGRYRYLFTADMLYLLIILTSSRFTGIVYKIGRGIIGICCGIFILVVPLFLGEVTRKHCRGRLSSYFYLAMTLGSLYYHLMNYITRKDSRIAVAGALLAILTLSGWCFVTESPVYLLAKDRPNDAKEALQTLRGPGLTEELLVTETTEMDNYVKSSPTVEDGCGLSSVIYGLTLGCLTMVLHVSLGNCIVFGLAAYTLKETYAGFLLSWPTVFGAIVPVFVADTWGRKLMMICSLLGIIVTIALMGFQVGGSHSRIPLTMAYCFSYSMGTGPVPWVLLGELFPYHVKPCAGTIILTIASAIQLAMVLKLAHYWKHPEVQTDIKYILCCFPAFMGLILCVKLFIKTRNVALINMPKYLETHMIPWVISSPKGIRLSQASVTPPPVTTLQM